MGGGGTDGANDTAPASDVAAIVAACLADLVANAPADSVLARLRSLEAEPIAAPLLRARFLRVRAVAENRLGFPSEALGDLLEARNLLQANPDPHELAEIIRTIALVHSWRGEPREAALALVQAAAVAAPRPADLAVVLMEGGRLHMEIGRPDDAELVLRHALQLAAPDLGVHERERAGVNLVQALVAGGRIEEARQRLATLLPAIAPGAQRLKFLLHLAAMRVAIAANDRAAARTALRCAADLVEADPASFEHIELAHGEAELALAEGNAVRAEELLESVIERYAATADDLAPHEIAARLQQARALDALQRPEDADRTLAAALRRALARGLVGYADTLRSQIAARGGSGAAWVTGAPAVIDAAADLGARFVRRRRLGAGGFGSAERAYDLELGIEVALKRISLAGIFNVDERRRLFDSARVEVAAASRVQHPGVVRIYGILIDDRGDALIIEELIEGRNLRAMMGTPMPPAQALDLLARIAFALAAVHAAAIVHRDVKPENIVLRDERTPVLVDFGVAVIGFRSRQPMAGTLDYMPPEQRRGGRIDGRADLYALGVIAHEMLLGRRPQTSHAALTGTHRARRGYRGELRRAGVDGETADLLAALLAPIRWFRPRAAARVGARLARSATLIAARS